MKLRIQLVPTLCLFGWFLDLTVPFTEKSVYKESSQGKAWGSNLSLEDSFSACFSLKKFLENILLKGKRRTDPDLIYQIGNPSIGALSYFHVGGLARGDPDLNQERFRVMVGWNMVVPK